MSKINFDVPHLCPNCNEPMQVLMPIWITPGIESVDTGSIDYESDNPNDSSNWFCENCESHHFPIGLDGDNAGCDDCGMNDRVPGSKYCAECGSLDAAVRSVVNGEERCEHTGMTRNELESLCGTGQGAGWRNEFREFDRDLEPILKRLNDEFGGCFYDSSWHNDTCPSFSTRDDSIRLWVNWKNPDMQEGFSHAFGIDIPGEEESLFDTDDLEEAIKFITIVLTGKAGKALRHHVSGAIERGEGVAITEQRADAKITELIRDVKDGDCALSAIFDDGSERRLFNFYIDELAFFDADLIGKTEIESHYIHQQRMVAYLQS